ncbi:MAG: hypothetical protein AB8G99_18725 [Planctomycetaceae bacterium]
MHKYLLLALTLLSTACEESRSRDFFLTIGGGYAPSGNQASLENNVLYVQRFMQRQALEKNDIFFADGTNPSADLEVMDPKSVPKANRLMAEFFGSTRNLGLSYRNHRVPNVRGGTNPKNVQNWFQTVGPTMQRGDRLIVYVTAHGSGSRDQRNTHETTIAMWNNSAMKMTEFVGLLDKLPQDVDVIVVMVQCHAGGFARFIFNGGNPKAGLSPQRRVGFFATVHDRQAAGCTPEVDETTYVEYSTYFWAAISGKDRTGKPVTRPDYNKDGEVSLEEAHAYTVLTADTIDLPLKSSGEFLTQHGRYGRPGGNLLTDDAVYADVLAVASPAQRAVLNGLSEQLGLSGEERVMNAFEVTRRGNRGRRRGRTQTRSPAFELKRKIAAAVRRKWPSLANVMNPKAIELLTTRSAEFIRAIEGHPDYRRYRELADRPAVNEQKKRVKYERFLRTVDNVIFAENLKREGKTELFSQYESIVAAERQPLFR